HLFGCDAGILALTDWKTPDIYEFFSGKKSCSFTFADMYDSLFPELKLQTNGKFGGGAASPASMKKRAALLSHIKLKTNAPALFDLGIWKTDANGIAAGKVKLPDFTGSMLLSAVTADSTRTGSGKSELTIKDRTGVTVSLPAAAAPGDEFESVFTLFNFDLPAGEGTFSLELPESWKALSKKDFTFSLAKGGQAVCRIKLLVPEKTGNHAIRYIYTFKSGKETVKKTGTATLAVRHKIPEGMESSFSLLPRGGNLVVSGKNDKWYPDPFSVTVTISDSPLSLLSDALDFLRSYPYGCLEQTAAGAFPMLSANALYACGLISKEHMQTANRTVMQASYRILSMLRYDGSFSMWPGAGNEFRSGTLFASHFLFEAEEKTSLSIPITARNLICRHLYNIADDASLARGERAYAAYILALADSSRFLKPARNLLADGKQDLASLFASAALIRGGFAAEGAYHMKQTLEKEVWREKDMPYSCADDNVRAGMVLYLLSRADAKAPGSLKLLDRLQQTLRKDGLGWGTTQANAWAVLGISSWAEANQLALDREAKNKTIGIIHLSSGKKIPVLTGKSVELQLEKDGENRIINNDSPGLFITMRTRGIMRKGVEKANGITVKREYLNKEGKVITKAAHGELVTVRLTTWTETFVPDAVIVDLLPGGLEIEDGSLATREKVSPGMDPDSPTVKFKENRHDRFLLFCDLEGKQVYTYKARAVIRGKYANCAIAAEKMYDPDTAALSLPEGFFEVK
ncbi:MAG: hypothetical protein IKA79_05035, partial [Lentisphaeria bacterium]|nr:hypothetical protein [Lentisphaeria bacterium]